MTANTPSPERRDGHSKLVYDKATRAIRAVDPHPSLEEDLVEVAVNALADAQYGFPLCDLILSDAELEGLHREARAVLSAVTPRIEAREREACAKVADSDAYVQGKVIAAVIRQRSGPPAGE